jgi:MYXO-CTERM domain-containing protein
MISPMAPRPLGALLSALALSLLITDAAALQQPDGTIIPQETNPPGQNLVDYLNAEGDSINPLTDAATTPETFVPQCALTFKVLARGAGQMNSFGWYNVTGQKPSLTELHELITCSDMPGAVKTLDIKNDPKYLGGEIGFFQATTEGKIPPNCVDWGNPSGTLGYVFYSQKAYNDDNTQPQPFIHLLIMDSKVFPGTFYFAWEDLFEGGDNDFEDLLMRVDGIQCTGGGEPCDTGQPGKCADGTLQCKNGELECIPNFGPSEEVCNSRDDDCDGEIDEGDVCPKCSSGEFPCPPGLVCNQAGICVDPKCEGVVCPAGEFCIGGNCQKPCEGIVCPFTQVCREGVCVDPCDGLACDADYVCVLGVCKAGCSCTGCPSGQVCVSSTQKCVETGCEDPATCAAGTHCIAGGQCVDDCQGAKCPLGQICSGGKCVPDADAGVGGSGGVSFDGGFSANGGVSAGGGTSGAGGATGGPPRGETDPASGCGCRAVGSGPGSLAALGALLALAGLLVSRRKRR